MCHQTAQIGFSQWISALINPLKASLKASFSSWYANQVQKQQGNHQLIDMRLSVLKPFGARWFIKTFQHVADNPDIKMASVSQE